MKVFVYGTLKRGHGNHGLLNGSRFVGAAVLFGEFVLLDSGFPVCVEQPHGAPVAGEVYEIDGATLQRLDHLEGEGSMYHRQLRTVVYEHGGADVAAVYVGDERRWGRTYIGGQWLTRDNFWNYTGRRAWQYDQGKE
jgi:gamma-glutamylcyclotransferase (GGCT)/AIG2-like uncharacterized protein YtfP